MTTTSHEQLEGLGTYEYGWADSDVAGALSSEGYAASAHPMGAGGQLCQHHCPVSHVAAEFPQICESETRAFERLLGTHVQRLATIANGDGICTTHIPSRGCHTVKSTADSDTAKTDHIVRTA
jgi:predicted ArsR family transcriptional regulator